MSMKALNDIRDMLCEELNELARKGELGAGDLEIIHKAVSSIKNIDKIEMYDGGYSRSGDWDADIRGTYGRAVLTVAATAILWAAIAGMTPVSICAASYRT